MGIYVNPGNEGFEESLRSEIYVDKSSLIAYTNKVLKTKQKYLCISRPRRFGKTMTAEMLSAYYSRGCESGGLFGNLHISKDMSYKNHLNQYNVIFINMQSFLSNSADIAAMKRLITERIRQELLKEYPGFVDKDETILSFILESVYEHTKRAFVIIIDEWDCVFREYKIDKKAQEAYLDFLRDLLKDKTYAALTYMTGILPIKKYGTHSALNMFREFSMTDPREMSEFVGFTQDEVIGLCNIYNMDYEQMSAWYNGYRFSNAETVYNPKSVVEALMSKAFRDYWSQTETFEALSVYIKANYDGLKDTVIALLAGEKKLINISNFSNDMVTFETSDDVLTLLIHLGYLTYDYEAKEVSIPNKEIMDEFVTAIRAVGWSELFKDNTLLIGISYDKKSKKHMCEIKRAKVI